MGYYEDIFLKGKSKCSNNKCNKDISKKEYLYSMKKLKKPLCKECKSIETKNKEIKKFSEVSGFERYKLLKE